MNVTAEVTTWNQAAAVAARTIFFTLYEQGLKLADIRAYLDRFIQQIQSGSVTPRQASMNWVNFGAIVLSAGTTEKVFPHRSHPGFEVYETNLADTIVRKQKDYGPDAITRFGTIGILVRTHDKVARLENLMAKNSDSPENESIQDNYLDLLGYASLGIILEKNQFFLPIH
jgi:hypothetical protein